MNDVGKRISRGRTADVHLWKPGMVLKLFRSGVPADDVDFERRLGKAVFAQGLPVPWVGEIVETDGRFGLEYELIEGPTMTEVLQRSPWRVRTLARLLATLHKEIH